MTLTHGENQHIGVHFVAVQVQKRSLCISTTNFGAKGDRC